jgi:hypothetical protein
MSFENRGKSTAIPAIRRFRIFPNKREQFARVLRIDGTGSSNVFRRCTINRYFDVVATFGRIDHQLSGGQFYISVISPGQNNFSSLNAGF